MKIPHYLNNSRLFSRFNESGNRMKSQGQTIWRVRARCRNDIPGTDAPGNGTFHHHSPSAFSQQQQQQIHHHQQQIQQQQQQQHEGSTNGLMMAPDPLLWEFLPYERSIVGQPPLAIVGTAWQWNMKVHDHWTPRKKVSWSFVSNATSPDNGNGSVHDGSDSSSALSASASPSSSNTLPRWLSLQGSKLKGTPTEPGVYPIAIEATFQEDNDPEPVVVRGNFTIQVSKAIGGWRTTVALPQDREVDSPEGDHGGGSGDMRYAHESSVGSGFGGGSAGSGDGADDVFPSLIGERMSQLSGMYANHG
jgi:Putative Ig domain